MSEKSRLFLPNPSLFYEIFREGPPGPSRPKCPLGSGGLSWKFGRTNQDLAETARISPSMGPFPRPFLSGGARWGARLRVPGELEWGFYVVRTSGSAGVSPHPGRRAGQAPGWAARGVRRRLGDVRIASPGQPGFHGGVFALWPPVEFGTHAWPTSEKVRRDARCRYFARVPQIFGNLGSPESEDMSTQGPSRTRPGDVDRMALACVSVSSD